MEGKTVTTTIEYRYFLPGDEMPIQAAAYAWGLCILPKLIFDQLSTTNDGAMVRMTMREQFEIEQFARDLATKILDSPERNAEMTVTNNPSLYIAECIKGFTEGYLFGLFAVSRNMMDLCLDPQHMFNIAVMFAWEIKMKEVAHLDTEDKETEKRIKDGVAKLHIIHNRYRQLN